MPARNAHAPEQPEMTMPGYCNAVLAPRAAQALVVVAELKAAQSTVL
jgi:hypothetical protein